MIEWIIDNPFWIIVLVFPLFLLFLRRKPGASFPSNHWNEQALIVSADDLSKRIIQSMKLCGFKSIEGDSSQNIFCAMTGISMFSFGENIQVDVQEVNGKAQVSIDSKCSLIFQLHDWGKNKRNCKNFIKYLQ